MDKSLSCHYTVRDAGENVQGDGLGRKTCLLSSRRRLVLQSLLFMISLAIPVVWRLFTLYLPSSQRLDFGLNSVLDATN